MFVLALWRPATGGPRVADVAKLGPVAEPRAPRVALPATVEVAAQRTIKRPFLVRPAELFAATDEDAVRAYHRDQARELFGTLRRRLGMTKAMSPDPNPESHATQTAEYLEGWVDGVIRTAPDLVDELAQEVQDTLCAKDRDRSLLLVTFRLIGSMPELASDAGFDCIFTEDAGEDIVLWGALDAWRASGLPKSAALAALEHTASDPRTRERFQPRRKRGPQGASEAERAAALAERPAWYGEPAPDTSSIPRTLETLTAIKGDQP